MAKYCNVCRQTYSVEYSSCPFCEVPALLDRSPPRRVPAGEPGMDLAAPVPAGQIDKMPLAQPGPQANGSDQTPKDESAAHIDLGSPVSLGREGDGPPSGASFVSWDSLVGSNAGDSARNLLGGPAATEDAESATKPSAASPRSSMWFYLAAVAIGVLLAILMKLMR